MAITKRMRFSWAFNTDLEYNVDFDYYLAKHLQIHGAYDSDYGFGAGLTFVY